MFSGGYSGREAQTETKRFREPSAPCGGDEPTISERTQGNVKRATESRGTVSIEVFLIVFKFFSRCRFYRGRLCTSYSVRVLTLMFQTLYLCRWKEESKSLTHKFEQTVAELR